MARSNKEYWRVFDKAWFKKNQPRLLSWINGSWLKRKLARYALRIDIKEDLAEISSSYYRIDLPDGKQRATFRTHDKYSKRVYYSCMSLWWILHFIDWIFLDRFVPQFSFGFATLTAYPQAGSGGSNTTCDGYFVRAGTVWADIQSSTTCDSVILNAQNALALRVVSSATTNEWAAIYRSAYTFDTSSIGSTSTITSAVLSTYGYSATNSFSTIDNDFYVCSFTPASNKEFVVDDYDQFGSTPFSSCGFESVSDSGYTDLSLKTAGKAHISKTSVTGFGHRWGADINNVEPSWLGSKNLEYSMYFSDYTGTSNDPKLEVEYDLGVTYKPSAIIIP